MRKGVQQSNVRGNSVAGLRVVKPAQMTNSGVCFGDRQDDA